MTRGTRSAAVDRVLAAIEALSTATGWLAGWLIMNVWLTLRATVAVARHTPGKRGGDGAPI